VPPNILTKATLTDTGDDGWEIVQGKRTLIERNGRDFELPNQHPFV
jgi:hypothetical protein